SDLATPTEKTPAAQSPASAEKATTKDPGAQAGAASSDTGSIFPFSLSDIGSFYLRLTRQSEPKAEFVPPQPAERPAAAQPK
ncbi:MAG: hypothetical protein ACXW3G_13920, partial [Rhodoplanes sp.]